MKKVLMISGHPDLKASVGNAGIISEFRKLCPDAKVRLLDEMYPEYRFDIKEEQEALVAADIIIWQFPFYWYSMPGLLKKWLDDVFVHGFAHGSKGKALEGKHLIISFTTGASADEYQHHKAMNYEVKEFLTPFIQTANLCGMQFEEPVFSNSMMYVPGISTAEDRLNVIKRAQDHAARLYSLVESI